MSTLTHEARRAARRANIGEPLTTGEIDAAIAVYEKAREVRLPVLKRLQQTSEYDPTARATRDDHERIRRVQHDMQSMLHGVTTQMGHFDTALTQFVDEPGLVAIEAALAKLREARTVTEQKAQRVAAGQYEYTGISGKAEVEGRVLKTGDVVELTATQAEAWQDRFVPFVQA